MKNENLYEKQALKATFSTIALNSLLCAMKLVAGILGKSAALTSDAIQSAGDVLRGVIVVIGVSMSAKAADKEHPYGHEIFECVTAMILAFLIAATGAILGYNSLTTLFYGEKPPVASLLALVVAFICVVIKLIMFFFTRIKAKALRSPALSAESKDHLSDVFASSGVCLGIIGAMAGLPEADSVAGVIMAALIIRTAFSIFKENASMITDESAGSDLEDEMLKSVEQLKGVESIDLLRTRRFGNRVYVELEISVDKELRVEDAHVISENVHDAIEKTFAPIVKHCMVHVNPA